MKAPAYLLFLCSLSLAGVAHNFNLSFTATGAASSIDSVTATNLATNEQIILPGNKNLILSVISGMPSGMNPQLNTLILPVRISQAAGLNHQAA